MQSRLVQLFAVLACVVLMGGVVFADNCPTTTLDNYLGAGYSCGINDKTFSDFQYSYSSNPPGSGIPAGGVTVTPITTSGNPGLQFSAGWFASTGSVTEMDSLIQYQVNVNPDGTLITDLSLSIDGVGFSGTGAVFVDETACLGAVLPDCSGGQIVTLSVYDSSEGSKLFDEVTFSGVTEISMVKDISVQAGTDGDARLGSVTNQFSEGQVPEPSSIILFGSGVLGVAGMLRRKIKR